MPIASDDTFDIDQECQEIEIRSHLKHMLNTPNKNKTVIFLDWDDTLLCTSALATRGTLLVR
jgi:hypothetical protein